MSLQLATKPAEIRIDPSERRGRDFLFSSWRLPGFAAFGPLDLVRNPYRVAGWIGKARGGGDFPLRLRHRFVLLEGAHGFAIPARSGNDIGESR